MLKLLLSDRGISLISTTTSTSITITDRYYYYYYSYYVTCGPSTYRIDFTYLYSSDASTNYLPHTTPYTHGRKRHPAADTAQYITTKPMLRAAHPYQPPAPVHIKTCHSLTAHVCSNKDWELAGRLSSFLPHTSLLTTRTLRLDLFPNQL